MGPKLSFWVVSRDSVAGRYKLLYRVLGCIKCTTLCFPKLRLVFSQRTYPIQFFRPKTKFLGGYARFRCLEVPVVRTGFGVHTMHHFMLPKFHLVFFRPKTKFLGGFARFRCREVPVVNRVLGYIQCTTLCFRSCVLFFRNEQAQSTSLGPILSFWVVSRDSVAGRYPL